MRRFPLALQGGVSALLVALAALAAGQDKPQEKPQEKQAEGSECRACHEAIAKGSWRIRLVFYEAGRFSPGGFLHLGCQGAYCEGEDIVPALLHFSPDLSDPEREELVRACRES